MILLIEDEEALAFAIVQSLKSKQFLVHHCTTISDARSFLSQHNNSHSKNEKPWLILLDRMLPDGEGLDFCEELRANHFDGCILVLTALGQTLDKVTGLRAGADDYLPKPFLFEELLARIESLKRRYDGSWTQKQDIWQVDVHKRMVLCPNGWVTLSALEFKLAHYLIEHSEQTIARDVLLKEVWGFKWLPETRTVDYFMGRLRKALEPKDKKYFHTVRGAGYLFSKTEQ